MKPLFLLSLASCSANTPISLPDVSSLTGKTYALHQTNEQPAAVVIFLDEHAKTVNEKGQYVVHHPGVLVQERQYTNYQHLYSQGIHSLYIESIATNQDAQELVTNSLLFLKDKGFVKDTLEENLGVAPLDLPELLTLDYGKNVSLYGIESQESITKQQQVVFSSPPSCADLEWLIIGRSQDIANNSVMFSRNLKKSVIVTIGWEHAASLKEALDTLKTDYVIIDPLLQPPKKTVLEQIETCRLKD